MSRSGHGRIDSHILREGRGSASESNATESPTLVILTNDFPLSDFGEAFIENELPYISTYFSEVIFVPRFARRNKVRASVTHTLKAGYTVIRPRQTPKAAIIRRVLRCALSPSLIRTSMDEVRAASKHGQTRPYLQVLKRLLMLEVRVSMVAQTLRECDYLGPRPVFYSFWLHGSAYVARRLSEEFGGVAVSRAHNYDIYHERSGYAPWHEVTLPGLQAVYACSRHGQQYLQTELPRWADKVDVALLGTRDRGVQSCPPVPGELHLLTVSRIARAKRLERMIEALSELKCHDLRIIWTHLGGARDPRDEERLIQAAQALPPGIEVVFRGNITNEQVLEHLESNRVDLFVNVSDFEGIPVSIMEALSFGIPVAATPVGGTPEIVQEQVNGYLLALEDVPKALSETIHSVAAMSRQESDNMRIRARHSWETAFAADVNYPVFFQRLLAHRDG